MTEWNALQRKIGGRATSLDKPLLLAAAERERGRLLDELDEALERARAELMAASHPEFRSARVFEVAHDIRQIAACANRQMTGVLAHYLASYLTHCFDRDRPIAADIADPLLRAIEQSFNVREGDPLLVAIVEESTRLIRRLGIVAQVGAGAVSPSDTTPSSNA